MNFDEIFSLDGISDNPQVIEAMMQQLGGKNLTPDVIRQLQGGAQMQPDQALNNEIEALVQSLFAPESAPQPSASGGRGPLAGAGVPVSDAQAAQLVAPTPAQTVAPAPPDASLGAGAALAQPSPASVADIANPVNVGPSPASVADITNPIAPPAGVPAQAAPTQDPQVPVAPPVAPVDNGLQDNQIPVPPAPTAVVQSAPVPPVASPDVPDAQPNVDALLNMLMSGGGDGGLTDTFGAEAARPQPNGDQAPEPRGPLTSIVGTKAVPQTHNPIPASLETPRQPASAAMGTYPGMAPDTGAAPGGPQAAPQNIGNGDIPLEQIIQHIMQQGGETAPEQAETAGHNQTAPTAAPTGVTDFSMTNFVRQLMGLGPVGSAATAR